VNCPFLPVSASQSDGEKGDRKSLEKRHILSCWMGVQLSRSIEKKRWKSLAPKKREKKKAKALSDRPVPIR
jgi:hypothetical protein